MAENNVAASNNASFIMITTQLNDCMISDQFVTCVFHQQQLILKYITIQLEQLKYHIIHNIVLSYLHTYNQCIVDIFNVQDQQKSICKNNQICEKNKNFTFFSNKVKTKPFQLLKKHQYKLIKHSDYNQKSDTLLKFILSKSYTQTNKCKYNNYDIQCQQTNDMNYKYLSPQSLNNITNVQTVKPLRTNLSIYKINDPQFTYNSTKLIQQLVQIIKQSRYKKLVFSIKEKVIISQYVDMQYTDNQAYSQIISVFSSIFYQKLQQIIQKANNKLQIKIFGDTKLAQLYLNTLISYQIVKVQNKTEVIQSNIAANKCQQVLNQDGIEVLSFTPIKSIIKNFVQDGTDLKQFNHNYAEYLEMLYSNQSNNKYEVFTICENCHQYRHKQELYNNVQIQIINSLKQEYNIVDFLKLNTYENIIIIDLVKQSITQLKFSEQQQQYFDYFFLKNNQHKECLDYLQKFKKQFITKYSLCGKNMGVEDCGQYSFQDLLQLKFQFDKLKNSQNVFYKYLYMQLLKNK